MSETKDREPKQRRQKQDRPEQGRPKQSRRESGEPKRLARLVGVRGSARRRHVWIAAAVLAVAVVTVAIPGYYASQPAFLQRFPSTAKEHKTWSASVHKTVSCQKCHVAPGFAPQAVYSARMLGEFYLTLVDRSREPQLLKQPKNASCGSSMCHFELRTVSATGDLKIPHRAHVNALNMKCVTCHKYLVHEVSPEGSHKPRMTTCLKCHDGHRAKNACTTCHTEKAAPAGHKAKDWVVVHPQKQGEIDCKKCHAWTDRWCAECHSRKPASHGAKWRSAHAAAVAKRRNCEACHTAEFCSKCHGEVPQLNYTSTLKLVK